MLFFSVYAFYSPLIPCVKRIKVFFCYASRDVFWDFFFSFATPCFLTDCVNVYE